MYNIWKKKQQTSTEVFKYKWFPLFCIMFLHVEVKQQNTVSCAHYFGSDWNKLTYICNQIYVTHRMNPTDFGHLLTFPPSATTSYKSTTSNALVQWIIILPSVCIVTSKLVLCISICIILYVTCKKLHRSFMNWLLPSLFSKELKPSWFIFSI